MPNLVKRRKLQRPVYSLAKQLNNDSPTPKVDIDDLVSKDEAEADKDNDEKSRNMNSQSEVTYSGDDYLAKIEGVDLSVMEPSDKTQHTLDNRDVSNSPTDDSPTETNIDDVMDDSKINERPLVITEPTDKKTYVENAVPVIIAQLEKRDSSQEKVDKEKSISDEEMDLDSIIANLQSVLPETSSAGRSDSIDEAITDLIESVPQRETRTISDNEYDDTKNIESASELSALIDSIVCDMDAFAKDPFGMGSSEAQPSETYPDQLSNPPNDGYHSRATERPGDIYATVDKRKRVDSTPELHHVSRGNQPERILTVPNYGYHSLRYTRNDPGFNTVTPDKKSVSFNNVVFEVETPRYRHSYMSSDTTLDSQKSPRNSHHFDPDYNPSMHQYMDPTDTTNETATFIPATSESNIHDDPTQVKGLYESVASLTDDVISMPSEDELYTSGNETETDDELSPKHEPFKPQKVRKFIKSRTALLILTWFVMGVLTLLPSNALRSPLETFTGSWVPSPEVLLSKGLGFFLGIIIGGLFGGVLTKGLEVVIIFGLLLLAGSMAVRPWCETFIFTTASHMAEGTGRGLATIASHLFLHYLWRSDTVFLIIHCLFIAFAAGASVVPPLTFILNMKADDLVTSVDARFLEKWLYIDLPDTNGTVNSQEAVRVQDNGFDYIDLTTSLPDEDINMKRHLIITMLPLGLAVIPLLLAVIMIAFALYTCISSCRNITREYKHKKKLREIEKLKEKIAKSSTNPKKFPNLNGSPGSTKKNGTLEKKTNGVLHNSKSEPSSIAEKESLLNSNEQEDTENTDKKDTEPDENGSAKDIDHVTHVVSGKQKTLTFKLPEKTEKKPQKLPTVKKSTPWLINNQSCSVGALLYLYVFFTLAAAIECIAAYFLYAYAIYGPLQLSQFRAILLLTLFLISVGFSRILALPISYVAPPNAFVVGCLTLSAISSAVFVIYGSKFDTIMWLFAALLGASIGPLLPGGFTWANIYLNLNSKSLGLAYCLMALGMSMFNTLAGALLQLVDAEAVMWLVVALCLFSFVLFLPTMPSIKSKKVLRLTSRSKADSVISDSKRTYV